MNDLNFWLKKIDPYLLELDEIPLFRGENFSFEDFSSSLKKELNLEESSLSCTIPGWQKQEEIKLPLGDEIEEICLTFTPLLGNVYLLLSHKDIQAFIQTFFEDKTSNNFSSSVFEEGFFRYLLLIILKQLKTMPTFAGLSAKIVEDAKIKISHAFCLDLNLKLNKACINTKIAITPDFRLSWNEFFSSKDSLTIDKLKSSLELPIQIIAGHCKLPSAEWQKVKKGDFILLDDSYIEPNLESGRVILSVNDSPLFFAKIKKNKINILEYAKYYKENESMDEHIKKEDEQTLIEELSPLKEEKIALEQTPVNLTIELVKVSMTLEKLMQLQPGNFLQLPISLDGPVNILANGKKIATGELTSIGESVGVRILQI